MTAYDSTFEIPPFPAFPSVSRYVPVGSLEDARQRISRSIDACEGLSLVIGPPGTGKSLLCAVLTRDYSATHDVVTLGETPIQDAATLYRHLLHHLGVSFDSIPEGDLQLAIVTRVRDPKATEKGLLVLVDEAQAISAEVLEAIRMTTNIMHNGQPRVYAVVCGGPKLDDTLALPALEPLTQRVAARCYLHPLNANETRQYISESIRHCGAVPEDTISDEAIGALHHACCGVPRLINQLVTSAIDVAADMEQDCITDAIIDRAWAELQQLPSPMIEEPSLHQGSSSVEFGELDESDSYEFTDAPETKSEAEIPAPEAAALDQDCDVECETGCEGSCEDKCSIEEMTLCGSAESNDMDLTYETELQLHDEESRGAESYGHVPVAGSTPPPNALFGDFDDEEEVMLGNGVAITQPQLNETPIDIEAMLHSEIIGIANDASTASHIGQGDDEADRHSGQALTFTEQNSVQWLDEVEGVESAADDDSDIVIQDDTDMLVIEDEVDLRAGEKTARIDSEEKIVSVDFQAMLARMRHGVPNDPS